MSDNYLNNEGKKLAKASPIYLIVQAVILLMTYLDTPVYHEAYRLNHTLTVNGWVGAWFVLVIFGLSIGILLLVSKTWKSVIGERERVKCSAGYLLGAVAGLLTLGLRFFPLMPPEYFYLVGGLVLVLAISYFVWTRRQASMGEIFP